MVWNHGILNDFPETVGNGTIIPTDFHSIIFQRGRSTTNQMNMLQIHNVYLTFLHEESIELLQRVKCLDVFGMSPTEGT